MARVSLVVLFALVSLLPVLAAEATGESEYGVLHEAPGVDLTYAYCAGCHSEKLVAQQGLTREDWDQMLDWMVEEQGMAEIEEPDRSLVLDYLAEHYNVDRPYFSPQ